MEEKLMQLQKRIEQDSSVRERLFELETSDEVKAFLSENGLDFSLEEIGILRDAVLKFIEQGEGGELSDDDLDDVAGGFAIRPWVGPVIGPIVGPGTGTNPVIMPGFPQRQKW